MASVTFQEEKCKGCGLCMTFCPKHILQMAPVRINAKGYHPAECIDQSQCIGCASCARMCPDVVIKVEK